MRLVGAFSLACFGVVVEAISEGAGVVAGFRIDIFCKVASCGLHVA